MTVFIGILAAFSLIGVLDGRSKALAICSTVCFAVSLAAMIVVKAL